MFFIPCVVSFYCAYKTFNTDFIEILSSKWTMINILMPLIGVFLLFVAGVDYSAISVITVFFIVLSTFLLVKSQENIDFMMARRRHKLEHLPSFIRRYVLMLTVAFIVVLLIMFLMLDFVVMGINAAGDLALVILRFLFSLMSSEPSVTEPVIEQTPPPAQNEGLPSVEDNQYSDIINIITYIVFSGLGLYLLFRFRKSIGNAFLNTFHKAVSFFFKTQQSDYYVDEEKAIIPSKKINKKAKKVTVKSWKKKYSQFLLMPTSAETYRYGYRLTLEWLSLKGAEYESSDTPLEILKKVRDILPESEWETPTHSYNRIRYSPEKGKEITETELRSLVEGMRKFIV